MKLLHIPFLLFIAVLSLKGQSNISEKKIELKDLNVGLTDSVLTAEVKIDFLSSDFPSESMLILTPRLESKVSDKSHTFENVIYVGANRSKVLNRSDMLTGKKTENVSVIKKNEQLNAEYLRISVPYESWMNKSELVITEQVSGCANCDLGTNKHHLNIPTLVSYTPTFSLAYITPKAEPIKERSREYTAKLNFKVGRSEILPELGRNATILNEVSRVINEVKEDKNLTINKIEITGFASPEGNEVSNLRLSENRAKSFANYLGQHYRFDTSVFSLNWKGEDWNGLEKAIRESSLTQKNQLLDLLNTESVATRKQKLKSFEGGAVYKTLLADYYPDLRRNEMVIRFVVKAFDLEEAKEIIRTRPQYLSLNEMYLVANSYTKGSNEFKQVFDVASNLFPNDQVAVLNAATAELENGSIDKAIEKLSAINTPEAWHNLAIAYAKKGELAKAKELMQKAADAGVEGADKNLSEIQKTLDN